jgi:hypothetical protein
MSRKLRALACVTSAVVPWLFAMAGTAAAEETFTKKTVIAVTGGLNSFDIGFVDADIHTYVLTDRTNKAIDVVDTATNTLTHQYPASPAFVGVFSPNGLGNASGPNGVIIVDHKEIWAADSPVLSCTGAPPKQTCTVVGGQTSSIKVIDLGTGVTTHTIYNGGVRRADELCEDVNHEIVMTANDDPLDNFLTFTSTEHYTNIGKIKLDGTDPDSRNNVVIAHGIEQCKFNPRTGSYYLAVPATKPDGSGPGVVLKISRGAPFHIQKVFTIDPATGCTGPQGLAIGPNHQILLGCGGANSLIIDDRDGDTLAFLGGQGNADEVWYNPGDNQYFVAESGNAQFGVIDHTGAADLPTPTAAGSHSIAADMLKNQIYVPGNKGATTLCGSSNGCIAVFTASGKDDRCLAEGMPVLDHDDGDDPVFMRVRCEDDRHADRDDHDRDR